MRRLWPLCLIALLCLSACHIESQPRVRRGYESLDRMMEEVDYTVYLPTDLPEGFALAEVYSMDQDIFRFVYRHGEKELVFSVSETDRDPSGDYDDYEIITSKTIYKYTLALKSHDGENYLAVFTVRTDKRDIHYAINPASMDELFTILGGLEPFEMPEEA